MADILPQSQFRNVEWLQNNTLAGYAAANQDLTGATYQYYGFMKQSGGWYIIRFKIDVTNIVIYTYARGNSSVTYSVNWDGTTGAYIGTLTFVSFANLNA